MTDALTIAEAIAATGASERTIRRRIAERAFPNAYKETPDPRSPWRIPVADLEAAGLHLRRAAALVGDPDAGAVAAVMVQHSEERLVESAARLAETTRDLQAALDRIALLEQLVADRDRQLEREQHHQTELQAAQDLLGVERAERLEDLTQERDHLRAQVETLQAVLSAPRRRWWQRG